MFMAQLRKDREVLEKMERRQPKIRSFSCGYISDGCHEWTKTKGSMIVALSQPKKCQAEPEWDYDVRIGFNETRRGEGLSNAKMG